MKNFHDSPRPSCTGTHIPPASFEHEGTATAHSGTPISHMEPTSSFRLNTVSPPERSTPTTLTALNARNHIVKDSNSMTVAAVLITGAESPEKSESIG